MKQMRVAAKSSRGEVMIESMLVVIITMFLLLFIIAMFSLLFFRWNMQTAANDIAARYAQSYPYLAYGSNVSFESGEPASSQSISLNPYRYIFSHTAEVDEAKQYALDRLTKSTAGFALGSAQVDIQVHSDFLGRRHVVVEISGGFKVLMQDVFAISLFNMDTLFQYKVYGYADCIDLLDYLNTVSFVKWAADGAGVKSKAVDVLNNIVSLVEKFQ